MPKIKHLHVQVLSFVLILVFHSIKSDGCTSLNYDFSSLKGTVFDVHSQNGSHHMSYNISICQDLQSLLPDSVPPKCNGSSACMSVDGDEAVSIGKQSFELQEEVTRNGELVLHLQGDSCQAIPDDFQKTIIIFKCGKTLGSPVFLDSYACDTYFEWYTTAACKKGVTAKKEVKCYQYDTDGKKYDLSPLIKRKGAHSVDTQGQSDESLYINVCRDITPDDSTSSCPEGMASCFIENGVVTPGGEPKKALERSTDGSLQLEYESSTIPGGCSEKAITKIKFICPKRGGSKPPVLTFQGDCHYDIEWHTEYACSEDVLTTTGCKLNLDQHGIDFDLTPLRNPPEADHPYTTIAPDGGNTKNYTYLLNVCGELGIPCPDADHQNGIAVCQLNAPMTDDFGKSMGKTEHQLMRYSDNQLSLIYRGGDTCSNHFQRTTIINFHCNKTAVNGGKGNPVFNSEEGCSYVFDWDTKYACLDSPIDAECGVEYNNKRYDLSLLTKSEGGNWEALDSQLGQGTKEHDRYFFNMCSNIQKTPEVEGCPEGSAACMRTTEGEVKSLGKYKYAPVYDESSKGLIMHYTEGSVCNGDKTIETFITLKCKPGDLESAPVFLQKNDEGCLYEFEWYTAVACVQGRKTGTNCKVFDDDAGFSYDLSKLTKTGDKAFYKVSPSGVKDKHDYYINVCAPVTGTPCADGSEHGNAGVCQQLRDSKDPPVNTGKPNSNLTYYDGMINLTYSEGEAYHTDPPILRATEILFICDSDAGDGLPEYNDETDHKYFFEWRTALACPEIPIECIVTDPATGDQYDLSSLSKTEEEGNWEKVNDEMSRKQKFYINVCRPVNPISLSPGCASDAGICGTLFTNDQEKMSVSNLGKVKGSPVVQSKGHLKLEYTDGAECSFLDGTKSVYSTSIELVCKEGATTEGPKEVVIVTNCHYSVVWETAAACPQKTVEGEGCMVKDPNSEYTFNLQSLKGTTYTTKDPDSGKSYSMRICESLPADECAKDQDRSPGVCEGEGRFLGEVNDKLEYAEAGVLKMTYSGGRQSNGKRIETVISFTCNKDTMGEVHFTRHDDVITEFEFKTALACPPETVDCQVTDSEGNEYDLSPLGKESGNWLAEDTRAEHKDLKYYINVCRPLNPVDDVTCPGGPIGGCQTDSNGVSHNLGYVQGKPMASPNRVVLHYLNGDLCHKGTPNQAHRSTRIIFECSEIEGDPVFQDETTECEYVFHWNTPAACPVKEITGSKCTVTDPLYGHTFDLSALTKVGSNDYEVPGDGYTFLINICSEINSGNGDCETGHNVGSCQTDLSNNLIVDAGKANDKLIYDDGAIRLEYKGGRDSCHGKYERKTIIFFTCHHGSYGTDGPSYRNETAECVYEFEWPTAAVCNPFNLVECTIANEEGLQYDLSALTLVDDNYEIKEPGTNKRFFLNVCTNLVHKKGTACPPNSAVCLADPDADDATKKYENLGKVSDHEMTLDGDHVVLTYSNGKDCASGDVGKTVIRFTCNKDAIDSEPTFESMEQGCIYRFQWETNKACPVNMNDKTTSDCKATGSTVDEAYDLNSLFRDEGYSVSDDNGHKIEFNVCGNLTSSSCDTATGACQVETSGDKSAGIGNKRLRFKDSGLLELNYENGEVCQQNNQRRNTIISFVCPHEGQGLGEPVFVYENEDCTYFITWHTDMACPPKLVPCNVIDAEGHTHDLSSLVKSKGHYAVVNDLSDGSGTFYINVCQPLYPMTNIPCPPNAASCKVIADQTPVSLGKLVSGPKMNENDKVVMIYENGTPCEKNGKKTNSSTKIVFSCGPSEGEPHLKEVSDDCQYLILWDTNAVCKEEEVPVTVAPDACSFQDPNTNVVYDFSSLQQKEKGALNYKVPKMTGDFYINVCNPVTNPTAKAAGCGNAGVCRVKDNKGTSYGNGGNVQFIKEGDDIKMLLTTGKKCEHDPTQTVNSIVLFQCSKDGQEDAVPQVYYLHECNVAFKWKTLLACPPQQCTFTHGRDFYDLGVLSRTTGSWDVYDIRGAKYHINICGPITGSPDSCPDHAAVCRTSNDGTIDVLGTAQSQRIYLQDKSLILEYTHGDAVCSNRKRSGTNPSATVKIVFKCGHAVGGPRHISSDMENCLFAFEWVSKIACTEERVPVKVDKGIITDPETNSLIDLNKLTEGRYVYAIPNSLDEYTYGIDLTKSLEKDGPCKTASICRYNPDRTNPTNVGKKENSKFSIKGGVIEVVLQSSTVCDADNTKTIESVIDVKCALEESPKSLPALTYKSRSCHYFFTWNTPLTCVHPNVVPLPPDGNSSPSGTGSNPASKAKTAVIVSAVFLSAFVICILVIVFHKPERRVAFKNRVRRIFKRGDGPLAYSYSSLSALEEDEPDGENTLFGDPSNSYGSREGGDANIKPYNPFHDDSDDDMIL